jgi:hypothetical protein
VAEGPIARPRRRASATSSPDALASLPRRRGARWPCSGLARSARSSRSTPAGSNRTQRQLASPTGSRRRFREAPPTPCASFVRSATPLNASALERSARDSRRSTASGPSRPPRFDADRSVRRDRCLARLQAGLRSRDGGRSRPHPPRGPWCAPDRCRSTRRRNPCALCRCERLDQPRPASRSSPSPRH